MKRRIRGFPAVLTGICAIVASFALAPGAAAKTLGCGSETLKGHPTAYDITAKGVSCKTARRLILESSPKGWTVKHRYLPASHVVVTTLTHSTDTITFRIHKTL